MHFTDDVAFALLLVWSGCHGRGKVGRGRGLGLAEGGTQLGRRLLDVARLLLDGGDALGRTGWLEGGILTQQVLEDLV